MIKLLSTMMKYSPADVRRAYIARMRDALGRKNSLEGQMVADGFCPVGEPPGPMPDGRVAVSVGGQSWALRPEVHAAILTAAFGDAKKRQPANETKSVVGTESLSSIVCPKCGDTLQHTAVCPACPAGKLGYRHRYTCGCGGADLISKDKL